jgi:predicted nucleic acid-binding protein
MITHLLDTSVYSQPLRRLPLATPLQRWSALGDKRCATSRICTAEVEAGLTAENRPERLAKYRHLLLPRLSILPVDDDTWASFSALKAQQHRLGLVVPDLDLLIGAQALRYGLALATLNAKHFRLIRELAVEDWNRS